MKQYGKKNKGFQKASDNRRVDKMRRLIVKRAKSRKGGPQLTASETEWLKKNYSF